VSSRQTISHGFPAAVQTDAPRARVAAPLDALPAAVALIADAPAQVVVAACTCYVPAAAAEPA
jgi:hypothetical protein